MATGEKLDILSGVFLLWGHEVDAAVFMLMVIPVDEGIDPLSCGVDVAEVAGRQRGVIFGCAEQGFGMGIVIAYTGAGVRGGDLKFFHEGQHGAGAQGAAVIAMEHNRGGVGGEIFSEGGAVQQGFAVLGVFAFKDLRSDDFAAKEVHDDVELEEDPRDGTGQPGDVPDPDFTRGGCGVGDRGASAPGCAGTAAVVELFMFAQDAVEAGFRGDIDPVVGEVGHDLGGWFGGVIRLIAYRHNGGLLCSAQGVGRRFASLPSTGAPIGPVGALRAPTPQGALVDAADPAGFVLARSGVHRFADKHQDGLAIRSACQASSLSPQIACNFFCSTSSAAVSASALSLRRTSRSSS